MQKTMHFALHFYAQKTMHFLFRFYVQKPYTLRCIFIRKIYILWVPFLYVKVIVLYCYLTINARTIRAIRSKNKFELFIESWSYSYDKEMVFDTYQRMRA